MWLYIPPSASSPSVPVEADLISASSWQFDALARSATWRGKPSPSRTWSRRRKWARRIGGSGFSSSRWLTPSAQNGERGGQDGAERLAAGHTLNLQDQVKMWPTPAARDWKGANSADHLDVSSGSLHLDQLPNFVEHVWTPPEGEAIRHSSLPAPTTCEDGALSSQPTPASRRQLGGMMLNANFVEWLMNWPAGWTEIVDMQQKSDPAKHCRSCGKPLSRKRIGERLEDRGAFLRRHYCDRSCMAAGMRKEDAILTRSAIQKKYRPSRKSACEGCGSSENLQLHHKDRNWRNNSPENHQTLCATCHMTLHHANGDINPTKPRPPCEICGKPSYRSSPPLCNTCRTRWRRHKQTVSTAFGCSETEWSLWRQHSRSALSRIGLPPDPPPGAAELVRMMED